MDMFMVYISGFFGLSAFGVSCVFIIGILSARSPRTVVESGTFHFAIILWLMAIGPRVVFG